MQDRPLSSVTAWEPRANGPADNYTAAVQLLASHFVVPQSTILQRILFRQHRQRVGESVHQYVADLRDLASFCSFGVLQDELIRDQLAEHTNSSKVQERLLSAPDDLTLIKAIEIAFQVETAAELTSKLAGSALFPSTTTVTTHEVGPSLWPESPDVSQAGHSPWLKSPPACQACSGVNLTERPRESPCRRC